jgi:hypothetical protein
MFQIFFEFILGKTQFFPIFPLFWLKRATKFVGESDGH